MREPRQRTVVGGHSDGTPGIWKNVVSERTATWSRGDREEGAPRDGRRAGIRSRRASYTEYRAQEFGFHAKVFGGLWTLLSRAAVLSKLCFRKFILLEVWRQNETERSVKKWLQWFRWKLMRLQLGQWWWRRIHWRKNSVTPWLSVWAWGRNDWCKIPDLAVWFVKTRHEKEEEKVSGGW